VVYRGNPLMLQSVEFLVITWGVTTLADALFVILSKNPPEHISEPLVLELKLV
jgi:hypothetical protein